MFVSVFSRLCGARIVGKVPCTANCYSTIEAYDSGGQYFTDFLLCTYVRLEPDALYDWAVSHTNLRARYRMGCIPFFTIE